MREYDAEVVCYINTLTVTKGTVCKRESRAIAAYGLIFFIANQATARIA
jgi:hypothetical protein